MTLDQAVWFITGGIVMYAIDRELYHRDAFMAWARRLARRGGS